MSLAYRFIIFDFDGTLADTGEGVLKSAKFALDFYRIPAPPWEELGFFVGPPLLDSFQMLEGVGYEQALLLVEKYRERYRRTGVYEAYLYPGMKELLTELCDAGATLGIASSKPTEFIDTLLTEFGISDVFTTVCGIGLEHVHHPKAQLIGQALLHCGCTVPGEALMVGDRKFDLEGAHQAGIKAAALEHGYGSRREFEEWNADYILQDTAALRSLLLP